MEETRTEGVLAVLPPGYSSAGSFREVAFSFWSREMLADYLTAHRQAAAEPLDLLDDIDPERELPVFIVEGESRERSKGLHLHRILRVEKN